MSKLVLSLVLVPVLVSGCGNSGGSPAAKGLVLEGAGAAGLAFTQVGADYQSSSLWYNDFKTGELREELSGESGDPAVEWLGDKLAFFNREAKSLNVRVYDPRAASAADATQVATPLAAGGDPHAVLALGGGRVLLAHYVAGRLVVTDAAFGAGTAVTADFDVGEGDMAQLRPEDLLLREGPAGREIYVLHQGRDKAFALNGSQQVFVLRDEGGTLVPVDLDPAKPKVQGIPLALSNPGGFLERGSATPLVASECTAWDPPACKAGLERVDLAARTATVVRSLDGLGLVGNGGTVEGEPGTLYWLMAKTTGEMHVMRLETNGAAAPASVHQYPAGSKGCCALFYEAPSKTLLIGDANADGSGFFTAIRNGGEPSRLDLDRIPYTGAFVPQ